MLQTPQLLPLALRERSKVLRSPIRSLSSIISLTLSLTQLLNSRHTDFLVFCEHSGHTPNSGLLYWLFLFLECSSPNIHTPHSITSFQFLVRCPLLPKIYLNRLTYSEVLLDDEGVDKIEGGKEDMFPMFRELECTEHHRL